MATNCDVLIARGIGADCTDPLVRGVEQRGVIMNYADVDFSAVEYDTANKHIVKTLALKAGKKGYEILQLGATPFNGTQSEGVVGDYGNSFTHTVQFVVLETGPDVAEMVDALVNGKFVVVLENNAKNLKKASSPGDSAYQIYGLEGGLRFSSGTAEKWNDSTKSGWLITLQETEAPSSALYLFNTDYATTQTEFESLMS